MAELYTPDTISVVITEIPDDKLTLAEFQWQSEQPDTTYTVDANRCISIEFSSFFPVRPSSVRWEHRGYIGDNTLLRNLFGGEFLEAMETAHELEGFRALSLNLNPEERLEIAELQLHSPSTPTALKHVCASMISEFRQREEGAA